MKRIDRRLFFATALGLGVPAVLALRTSYRSRRRWIERRDLYAEGVASGDPHADSVILWTRRPLPAGEEQLTLEVAEDESFARVIATVRTKVSAAADWTCRVLVGGLRPGSVYWYRFSDTQGFGSRVGRTITAPANDDARPVKFAFVSCQNPNQGAQNAYRRMIWEDQRAPPADRLGFVLHLGDFIYEIVWYPEDRPQGMYDRRLRDIVRYAHGERHEDFHVPTDLEDYRAVYRAYLRDPDLQDARAYLPFVAMGDNHEFSWLGWQGFQEFGKGPVPAQTRKVAANQAWFEYQPARVTKSSGPSLDLFDPPAVHDAPITTFDDAGLGQEANNLAALGSLTTYRALRWGRHVDLILTDQHSYRSYDPTSRPEASVFSPRAWLDMTPEDVFRVLDAGRTHDRGAPPATLTFGETTIPNFARHEPPQTVLGATQKAWFQERLRTSEATWKLWGNTQGTLDCRTDPQHLPVDFPVKWPSPSYACFGGGDPSTAFVERSEIYDLVAREKISGFATISGDRHSFWAGLAASALPPARFEPVGVAFVVGSISAPGLVEAREHGLKKENPLYPLYFYNPPGAERPLPAVNMLIRHGVRSCLELTRSGDASRARALSNPDNAPHLSFVDMGGHGYAVVTASVDALTTEFVCIPRPLERAAGEDGGPIRYRVRHTAPLWRPGERPVLRQEIVEGDAGLSI